MNPAALQRSGRGQGERVTLEVVHETRYAYSSPVSAARHRLHLRPLEDDRQDLLDWRLEAEPASAQCRHAIDVFGNPLSWIDVDQAHTQLLLRATSQVSVAPPVPWDPQSTQRWEAVQERMRYVARGAFEPAVEFVQPSPFVPRLDELRRWAAASFVPDAPVGVGALDLMHRLHAQCEYRSRSTDVHTPLAQAWAQRAGVCQDFAHLMIGGLRMLGLAARYVSGYLLTVAGSGRPALVGADASHAWVQVWCPGAVPDSVARRAAPALGGDSSPAVPGEWVDLDPTNDLIVSSGHVRLAVGRDYGDVAPVRGVIQGGGRHVLSVGVTTRRLDPARELLALAGDGTTAANEGQTG